MSRRWIASAALAAALVLTGGRRCGSRRSPDGERQAGFLRPLYAAVHGEGHRTAWESDLQRRQDGTGEAWRRKPVYRPRTGDARLDEPRAMCLPAGFPSGMLYILPIQIVQNPKHIVIIPELQRAARIIPTDGRAHRTGIEPSYYGDSVGRWDGDTLVIETVNFKPWILDDYHYTDPTKSRWHTDALRTTEHLTRDGNKLQYASPSTIPRSSRSPSRRIRADASARLGAARPPGVRVRGEQPLRGRQLPPVRDAVVASRRLAGARQVFEHHPPADHLSESGFLARAAKKSPRCSSLRCREGPLTGKDQRRAGRAPFEGGLDVGTVVVPVLAVIVLALAWSGQGSWSASWTSGTAAYHGAGASRAGLGGAITRNVIVASGSFYVTSGPRHCRTSPARCASSAERS